MRSAEQTKLSNNLSRVAVRLRHVSPDESHTANASRIRAEYKALDNATRRPSDETASLSAARRLRAAATSGRFRGAAVRFPAFPLSEHLAGIPLM